MEQDRDSEMDIIVTAYSWKSKELLKLIIPYCIILQLPELYQPQLFHCLIINDQMQ